jgi:hypothetical protein
VKPAVLNASPMIVLARAGYLDLIPKRPHHPTSILEWVLLFSIALPVTLLGEWLGDGLMDNPLTVRIERKTRSSKLSGARIAYFVAMLVLLAICAVALLYWTQSPG